MKTNIVIFTILTVYFVVVDAVYVGWNWAVHQKVEWAGSIGILLAGALTALLGYYLVLVVKKQGGVLVEDRLDADIDDGDPEIGEFSPFSWWPFTLASGLALVAIGLATGNLWTWWWMAIFSLPLVVVGLVGWIYEYYRGNFAR